MPLFWIVHEQDSKRRFLIEEGSTLIFARLNAAIAGFEGDFVEGHKLDAARAKMVPKKMIGHVLTEMEALTLLDRMA